MSRAESKQNHLNKINELQTATSFVQYNSSNTHSIFHCFTLRINNPIRSKEAGLERLVEVGDGRFTHVWRRSRFRSLRSLCLFILRLRFFLTLSAHTSAAPPVTSSSQIGSRHGRIWRLGWNERRASRMLGGGISPDAEHGRCGTGAGEGACWICGESRVSRGIAGSGGGSRRRWRSRRSGAAAAIGGAGAGSEGQAGSKERLLIS
jgi:hypothetical protein